MLNKRGRGDQDALMMGEGGCKQCKTHKTVAKSEEVGGGGIISQNLRKIKYNFNFCPTTNDNPINNFIII